MRSLALLCLLLPVLTRAQERVPFVPGPTLTAEARDSGRKLFERASFPVVAGGELPYRLLRPVSTPTAPVPLIIVLHGSGAIGTDIEAQLNDLALGFAQPAIRRAYPAYVVAPQFATRSANYHVSSYDKLMASVPGASLLPLFGLIAELTRTLPIDRTRIYLVGFSMGASSAWLSESLHPELFAAAVLLAPVPPERLLAPSFRQMPLLICHGDADTENPYDADLAMYKAIGPQSRVRFRTYPGMGHAIPPDVLDPGATWWRDWLFAQRRTATGASGTALPE